MSHRVEARFSLSFGKAQRALESAFLFADFDLSSLYESLREVGKEVGVEVRGWMGVESAEAAGAFASGVNLYL